MNIGFIIFTDLSKIRGDAIHIKKLIKAFDKSPLKVDLLIDKTESIQLKQKHLDFAKKILGRLIFLPRILTVKDRYELFYIRDWLFAYLMSFFRFSYAFEVNGLLSYEGLIRDYFKPGSTAHAIFKRIEKRVLNSAAKIVCVSKGMKDYCIGLGIDQQKILVAENAADIEVFNPEAPKAEIDGRNSKVLIGWMGSFQSHHGFEDLVSIAARLRNRDCADVKFLIIGGGSAVSELKQRLAKESLQDYFIFCGNVAWNKVPGYLLNTEFCLSLDRRSGENLKYRNIIGVTQTKVYEYLALGKAVLAGDLGNARDFFEVRKIGWVCGTGPEEVAEKIIEIIKDPRQISEYSKNALTLSKKEYSWKTTAAKIIDFLTEPA